jgi:hypothetical protein
MREREEFQEWGRHSRRTDMEGGMEGGMEGTGEPH